MVTLTDVLTTKEEVITRVKTSVADSDNDFCSGCRNVSQCHPFSGLHSPGRSCFTDL